MEKLSSRKLWIAIAAFLAAVGTGVTGLVVGNYDLTTVGAVCCVISAGMYAAAEAYVDAASASSVTTSMTVSASTTAREVVEQALSTGSEDGVDHGE